MKPYLKNETVYRRVTKYSTINSLKLPIGMLKTS